jgi:hypothetical protein
MPDEFPLDAVKSQNAQPCFGMEIMMEMMLTNRSWKKGRVESVEAYGL